MDMQITSEATRKKIRSLLDQHNEIITRAHAMISQFKDEIPAERQIEVESIMFTHRSIGKIIIKICKGIADEDFVTFKYLDLIYVVFDDNIVKLDPDEIDNLMEPGTTP